MSASARSAGLLVGAALSICAVVVLRAAQIPSMQAEPVGEPYAVDVALVTTLVSEALSFPTVSGAAHHEAFEALHAWHRARFPAFHGALRQHDTLNDSWLFEWPGSDPSLEPVLFIAHQDVVPVEPGTASGWQYPPFSGAVAPCGDWPGDCVWGRGALDVKVGLVGLSRAVAELAASGWRPRRTLYFWFSDDEEIGGASTAALGRVWEREQLDFAFIVDEGLVVTDGLVPGVSMPAALIGIAEKGYLTVEVRASGGMGHASMPPPTTTIGDLSRVVAALEASPFPAALDGAAEALFAHLNAEMKWPERAIFANLWLFRSLVLGQLESSRSTNALVRTTMVATRLRAGEADNALPQYASATLNLRIHPRDSIDSALEHVVAVAAEAGESITVSVVDGAGNMEPSVVSPIDHPGYRLLHEAIRRQLPEVVVAPGLFVAATDSRLLRSRSQAIYRFSPVRVRPDDVGRVHGTNERIRVGDLGWAFGFYRDVVQHAGELEGMD